MLLRSGEEGVSGLSVDGCGAAVTAAAAAAAEPDDVALVSADTSVPNAGWAMSAAGLDALGAPGADVGSIAAYGAGAVRDGGGGVSRAAVRV